MKSKIFLGLVLVFFVSIPALARERIFDNAGVLNAQERTLLGEMAESLASAYNFDLVIVIERNIGNVFPGSYAAEFFDRLGPDRDGMLFLHVIESRDYFFNTSGRGIRLINDAALDKMEADVLVQLRAGNNFQAYRAFLTNSETFLDLEARGMSYNIFHRWNGIMVFVVWLFSLVIGFVTVGIWKKQMNTALQKTQADSYVVPGSFNLQVQKDQFLYSTVTKTRRESQSNSGGKSGGLRTSSSGRSHGGRGGKY